MIALSGEAVEISDSTRWHDRSARGCDCRITGWLPGLAIADAPGTLRMAVRVRRGTAPLEFMGRLREIGDAVAPDLDMGQLATTAAAEQERSSGLRLLAIMIVAIMGSGRCYLPARARTCSPQSLWC